MARKLSVFISYASEDRLKVEDLAFYLSYDGFDPWMDRDQLRPGEIWAERAERAIEESDVALICLTRKSVNKRGFVQKEIKKVLDVAKEIPEGREFVIPIRFEPCSVPHALRKWQWVDLFEIDGYGKLRSVLEQVSRGLRIRCSTAIRSSLNGVYRATGTNSDGSNYDGIVLIWQSGDVYHITWKIAGDRYKAVGTLHRNKLTVHGDFDFSYVLQKDGRYVGEWEKGAHETLTRIKAAADLIARWPELY